MHSRQPGDLLRQLEPRRLPPIDQWNPPLSGVMDLRITRDGRWYHEGRPIERITLVRLFASILRRESDGHHYLVTPVEKWRVEVEDAPFLAVSLNAAGRGARQELAFRTNLDEWVTAGPDRPLVVEYHAGSEQPAPFVHLRNGLRARLTRSVFLDLAELAEPAQMAEGVVYGVWSRGCLFALGPVT